MGVSKEVFKQFRIESPLLFLQVEKEQTSVKTRFSEKSLLPTAYCRSVTKHKLIEISLRKAYNWLTVHNLIPIDFAKMTRAQIDTHLKQKNNLYVFDGLELRKLFSRSQSPDVEKLGKTIGLRSRIKTPFNFFNTVLTY